MTKCLHHFKEKSDSFFKSDLFLYFDSVQEYPSHYGNTSLLALFAEPSLYAPAHIFLSFFLQWNFAIKIRSQYFPSSSNSSRKHPSSTNPAFR